MKTPRDWPTRLKGCRTSVTGTLRGVLSLDASGRDALKTIAVIPVLAPQQPPRRRSPSATGVFFDCE